MLMLARCDQTDVSEGGPFDYVARNEAGEVAVSGVLDLTFGNGSTEPVEEMIGGSWSLRHIKSNEEVGPQVGDGDVKGSIDVDGNLWINLNPGWADNNVFLTGRFTGDRYADFSGTWSYSTLAGHTAGGVFEAERR